MLNISSGPVRLWSSFVVVAIVVSLFAARLVQLQGVEAGSYAAIAAKKDTNSVVLEAPRGTIFDRNGTPLAQTVDASMITANPRYTSAHAPEIATLLHSRLGVDYFTTLDLLRKQHTLYVRVARHIDPTVAKAVVQQLNDHNLPGLYVDKDNLRRYAAGDVAANVIGVVGTDGAGLGGLEYSLNKTLSGRNGSATFQVIGGQQLPLADHTVIKPQLGTSVRLTIDKDLQYLAQQRVARAVEDVRATSGSVVIQDVRTGQLLALADYPSFNPNHVDRAKRANLGSRAAQDPYEPGSVEKVLTFSALIDSGAVTPRTKIVVPPSLVIDNRPIKDYFAHGTLRLTAAGVIAKSSNLGTVQAVRQLPKRTLYRYLRKFGLGQRPGIGLAGVTAGILHGSSHWSDVNRATISYGQGVSVSAVQIAAALGTIANGGVYVSPSLIAATIDGSGKPTPAKAPAEHRVITRSTATQVTHMMETVTGAGGTAPNAAIPGYRVAGKTGTANRVDPACACYRGYTVSFGGFAPADKPRFVIYVVIQNPQGEAGGGVTAGPVFHDLMVAALAKYGVAPTGSKSPVLPLSW
jgi:cell division protein FtsI (penicillin-binding protein 3)